MIQWPTHPHSLKYASDQHHEAKQPQRYHLDIVNVTRLLSEPRPSGGAEGVVPDLGLMLEEYYAARGWTPEGAPSPERLAELGLA